MSSNKRKAAPLSVSAGLLSSEQAGQAGGAPSSSKRSRVDVDASGDGNEGEEDLEGDLDLQEQERKRLQQGRKGRVVTAGYDSDEESDGSEADGDEDEGKSNGKVAGVDEDDDMFALEGEDDEEGGRSKSKGTQKGKKYLELGDIEGQEFTAKDAEDEGRDAELELETDEEEYEVDSEEKEALHDPDAVVQPLKKKKKRPKPGDKEDMGFEIDSFNMKNEMATGRFDDEGNYIANAKDPHAEHDKWLTGNYSRKGIRAAREAKEKQEKNLRAKEKKQAYADLDEEECKMKLAELMERGESVLEALQRVGRQVKRGGSTGKKKGSESNGQEEDNAQAKTELEQLTSLSSALMSRFGRVNVYDETYEGLLRVVRRSGLVRETWDPAAKRESANQATEERAEQKNDGSSSRQFIYKWSPSYLAATATTDSSQADSTFGPYPATDLQAWFSSGYFGDRGERILLRDPSDVESDPARGWKTWEEAF